MNVKLKVGGVDNMKNPIVDLTATLILLIVILVGGYLYAKNKEDISRSKVVEIPVTVVNPVEKDKPKYDKTKFETAHKITE